MPAERYRTVRFLASAAALGAALFQVGCGGYRPTADTFALPEWGNLPAETSRPARSTEKLKDRSPAGAAGPATTSGPEKTPGPAPAKEEVLFHRVRPKETLSGISLHYYGSCRFYRALGIHNGIRDPDRISAGMVLKIPPSPADLPPVPEAGKKKKEDPPQQAAFRDPGRRPGGVFPESRPEPFVGEPGIPFPLEGMNSRPLLGPDPREPDTGGLYETLYLKGQRSLRAGRYMEAREQFRACLALKADSAPCRRGLELSESRYKERHYRKGFLLYRQERIAGALREWECVAALDPAYGGVEDLIEKARRMLRRIEDLKQKKTAPQGG